MFCLREREPPPGEPQDVLEEVPDERLRGVLGSMRATGELRCVGRGRGAVWERREPADTPPAEG